MAAMDHRMTASPKTAEVGPSLAEQVSRLYDLIAGYHMTNLIEVAREVGVWERIAAEPGITSASLADALGTNVHYTDVLCRTAFAFELLEREGDGWRMAAHMDTILGDPASTFYLGRAAKVHLTLGKRGIPGPRGSAATRAGRALPGPQRRPSSARSDRQPLRSLPRMFVDLVLPRLPDLDARLAAGARGWARDLGCGAGWAIAIERWSRSAIRQAASTAGISSRRSIALAQERILQHGLTGTLQGATPRSRGLDR